MERKIKCNNKDLTVKKLQQSWDQTFIEKYLYYIKWKIATYIKLFDLQYS